MDDRYEPPRDADEVAHAVIGAAIEVHRHLGPGLLESTYERALELELALRRIPYERQKEITVKYKGAAVGQQRLDLVAGGSVIVELKCVEALVSVHYSQLGAYLQASGLPLGLLLNFQTSTLKNGIRRVIPPQR